MGPLTNRHAGSQSMDSSMASAGWSNRALSSRFQRSRQPPALRGVTGDLYGGGPETRIRQELVLGIGGWRLLRMLGLRPEVCHLNEGHAAFVVLARARSFMEE